MATQPTFWEQFEADCASLAPGVGAVTGAVYGYGAETIGLGKIGEMVVDETISGFVTENWPDTCSLPGIIAEAIGPTPQASAIDAPTQGGDQSVSISD